MKGCLMDRELLATIIAVQTNNTINVEYFSGSKPLGAAILIDHLKILLFLLLDFSRKVAAYKIITWYS